jgi:hypothetical protein
MAYEHPSGLPDTHARHRNQQKVQSLVFGGRRTLLQGAELNDLQDVVRGRQERLGRLIAKDGDRTAGGLIVVDQDSGTVTVTSGKIYVAGDEFPVEERVISSVPMIGDVEIGVRLVRTYIDGDDDPALRGLVPGTLAEGENGAARELASIYWSLGSSDEDGIFYQVYLLQSGSVIDQKPPPLLSGMHQAIAEYDRPHGHYIVSGCRVSALGSNNGAQHFSIEEGEANIYGFKNIRQSATRLSEPEDWDVGAVPGETHIYAGGESQTIEVDRTPIAAVSQILLTKQKTVPVTRGVLANGVDGLPDSSVIEIVSVSQGAVTYVAETDYRRTGSNVDWGAPGNEPLSGSTYTVTYRYRASVEASAVSDTSVTVEDGAEGGDVILSYTYKLPRVDLIGLQPSGLPVYIKGVSARSNPSMPIPPRNVLPLCAVSNNWFGLPVISVDGERTGVRLPTWATVQRMFNLVEDLSRLLQLERLKSEVDRRDPTAKRNMFVDPFENDYYRDQGVAQTGAVGDGVLQLAIEPTFYDIEHSDPIMLDWVEEVLVDQSLRTGCEKINPYQNFTPMPGDLILTPAVDQWVVTETEFTSAVTREIQRGTSRNGSSRTSTTVVQVGERNELLPFLRQRELAYRIAGFFPGEVLQSFDFDGVSILPDVETVADAEGEIVGSFTIPADITAGTKLVQAEGAGGTIAEALFTGQGRIEVDIMRRVTTITRTRERERESRSDRDPRPVSLPVRRCDPQAQIFGVTFNRQIVGVDFHLCAIGDRANHILVHQVTVENGIPTTSIEAEAFLPMTTPSEGWVSTRYKLPVVAENDRDHAFVIKTDDGNHAISIAALGGFDTGLQRPVTSHPYPVGPRLSSVNASTWTPHQDESLAFRLVAARFPVTTKTVDLGTFDLVDCSDLQVRAVVDLPSAACAVWFEIERANGDVFEALPYQLIELGEYLTETVTLRAVLEGTEMLSPVLYVPIQLIAGKIASTGTYVSRAMDISTSANLSAYFKKALPWGSTVEVTYDLADDNWRPLPLHGNEISPDPEWVEANHRVEGLDANLFRIKIAITGGPAARPLIADLGLASS